MVKTQEAAHTPGPWWITESGVRDRGGYICHTNPPPHYAGQDERFAKETAERAANKVLIAAAPDLLQALLQLKRVGNDFAEWHPKFSPAIDAIYAALAKATGAVAPAAPSLALTAFIQDVEAAEGKATGAAA